jgi:hypothetical protein
MYILSNANSECQGARKTCGNCISLSNLISSVKRNNYEELIVSMIKRGTVLDHSKSPCEENFIPDKKVS